MTRLRDRDVEVGQKYLLNIDSTQNTTEEERLRKLKRKLKREMHLEKSWGFRMYQVGDYVKVLRKAVILKS